MTMLYALEMRNKKVVIAAIERAKRAGISYRTMCDESGADYDAVQKADKRQVLARDQIALIEPYLDERGYFSPEPTAEEMAPIQPVGRKSDIFAEISNRLNNAALSALQSKLNESSKAKAVKKDLLTILDVYGGILDDLIET